MSYGPQESLQRQRQIFDEEKAGTYKPDPMSNEEVNRLEEKVKALNELLRDQVRATYKLEVQFGKGRTISGEPYAGVISCWLSGTKLHGGGDEKIYECPNPECKKWILPSSLGTGMRKDDRGDLRPIAVGHCGHCGSVWPAEELIGERFLKLTVQHWVDAILGMFARLDLDADIYLKYHPTDIRYKSAMEMARNRGGEELAKARKNRGLHIYPLRNIIKDTKHGADLHGRIKAFITS